MNSIASQFFNVDVMALIFPIILRGLGMTLLLCAAVIPLGLIGGLLVAGLMQVPSRLLRVPVAVFVDLMRALPPLFLLLLVYAGLPFVGIQLPSFATVCLAFLLNTSAYYSEVYRAGFESVGTGQREAARSTGLNSVQTYIYVVMPQAVRNVLPDLVSNTVEVIKSTSLASVVALPELLYAADTARAVTHNSSPMVLAAAIYLFMLWPAVRLISRMEHAVGR